MQRLSTVLTVGLLALGSASAYAEQSCETVKMADPGWSDIAATNAITGFLLDGMGYKAKVDTLAVPITFGGLKDGQVDVFLGNWMPAQQGFYDKFVANGDVTQLAKNLDGTEFTLAVPDYVWDAGVHNFNDLNKYAELHPKKSTRRSMASAPAPRRTFRCKRSSRRTTSIWVNGSWSNPASRRCWPKCPAR